MAETVGAATYEINADDSKFIKTTDSVKKGNAEMGKSFDRLDTKVTKSAKGVNKAMAGMGRQAGQAGIQFQQFIGQIQGGQSVMLALSAQSADLGFVLGAPLLGAIAGITASLVGMLLPALFSSTKGMEMMEKATQNVQASITIGADGVANYADEMKKLKQISEELARVKLATLIAEQEAALTKAADSVKKSLKDSTSWFSADTVELFGKTTGETARAWLTLDDAITNFDSKKPEESIEKLTRALVDSEKAGLNTTKSGRELANQMVSIIAQYKNGKLTVDALNKALETMNLTEDDTIKKHKSLASAVDSMVASLSLQAESIGKTDREMALFVANQNNATQAQLEAINASYDAIEAEESRLEVMKSINAEMDKSFKADAKKAAADKKTQDKAVAETEAVVARGETPEEKLAKEMELIEQRHEMGLISEQLYQDALTQIQDEGERNRERMNQQVLSASANFFGESAELIGAFAGESSAAYKVLFGISKGFAIANAAIQLQTAIANASALPFPANVPAITQAVSLGTSIASNLGSLTYSGGRENGGPVSAGNMYHVGENNKPEVLQMGSGLSMIPGDNGKVFNQNQLDEIDGGSGGGFSIQIINEPGVVSTVISQDDRNAIIKSSVNTMQQNFIGQQNNKSGPMYNATKQNYGQGSTNGRLT